jgi:hypothetical protein
MSMSFIINSNDLFIDIFEGEYVFQWAGYEEPIEEDFQELATRMNWVLNDFNTVFNNVARYWMACGIIKSGYKSKERL